MTIRSRLRSAERRLGIHERKTLLIAWPCSDIESTKRRVKLARFRGWNVRVIRFTLDARTVLAMTSDVADGDTETAIALQAPMLPRWLAEASRSAS